MGYREFQLLMIFWNLGLVDTYSVLKLIVNTGSQYVAVVLSSAAGNTSDLGIKSLFEPVCGIGTSYRFVQAAATTVKRRQRIATLAAFFAASGGALTTDPTTNAAIGSAVASKIGYMRAILARGGGCSQIQQIPALKNFVIIADPIKPSVLKVHPYWAEFTTNSKMIIDNMFQEHTTRRYLHGSAQKFKMLAPTYLTPITSTQITNTAVIGWTFFGVGLIGFTTLGALYLFQRAERKRYQNQNDKILIDETGFVSD